MAFKAVFLLFKPFSRRCRLMVIGLQSASVWALIWVKDRPVSSRTARRILRRSAGEFFGGFNTSIFLSHNSQDLLKIKKDCLTASNLGSDPTCHVQRQKTFLPLPS